MTDKEIAATLKAIKEHGEFLRKQSKEYVAQYLKALVGEADFPPNPIMDVMIETPLTIEALKKRIGDLMGEYNALVFNSEKNERKLEATIQSQQETIEKLKESLDSILNCAYPSTDMIMITRERARKLLQSLDNQNEDI